MADAVVNKLFVGRLPAGATRDDVAFVFSKYGDVLDVRMRYSLGAQPYAFVRYATWTESERAIKELHGSCIIGLEPLVVRFADIQKAEPEDVTCADRKLFVGSLPLNLSTPDLEPVFNRFGEIEELYVLRRPDGMSQGCAFVKFKTWAAAENAINELQGTPYPGHNLPMVIHFATARKQQNLNQDRLLLEGAKAAFSALPAWSEMVWPESASEGQFEDRKLFVGQLRPNVSEGDLLPLLLPFGSVKQLYVLRDRTTGRSKGCAFVVYAAADQARAAMAALDGKVLGANARPLTVCFASRKPAAASLAPAEADAEAEDAEGEHKLFVGQVPRTAREADLLPLFQPFGLLTRLYCLKDKRFGSNQGCAFVVYKTRSAAERAIAFHHGRTFLRHDRPLIVRFATPALDGSAG